MGTKLIAKNLLQLLYIIGTYQHNNPSSYRGFYHYTSFSAKNRIVGSDNSLSFFLTSANKFLDKNEGYHINEPYKYACARLYHNGKIDSTFYNKLKLIKLNKLPKDNMPWILSFCVNGNSQYMKERYAPADGWIIKINAILKTDLEDLVKINEQIERIEWYEIKYSTKDIVSDLERTLLEVYNLYKKEKSVNKNKLLKEIVYLVLSKFSYVYKGLSYENEEEVRLIIYINNKILQCKKDNGLELFIDKKTKRLCLKANSSYFLDASQKTDIIEDQCINKWITSKEDFRKLFTNNIKNESTNDKEIGGTMKSYRKELVFNIPSRRAFVNITSDVQKAITESGVREGLVLVNAMNITASVFINDDEMGLHADLDKWLERLAPEKPYSQYAHNGFEDNADAHMKRQIMGREVVCAITEGKLDFGTWEQIFYGEFDGKRSKRVLIKIIGE